VPAATCNQRILTHHDGAHGVTRPTYRTANLDCGGKRSATPLSERTKIFRQSESFPPARKRRRRFRSIGALHDASVPTAQPFPGARLYLKDQPQHIRNHTQHEPFSPAFANHALRLVLRTQSRSVPPRPFRSAAHPPSP